MADFPIVGIGCSAGGLETLQAVFQSMPRDPGMAFVVINHSDPCCRARRG
jgi:two-component system CheB/CheR fusion protein